MQNLHTHRSKSPSFRLQTSRTNNLHAFQDDRSVRNSLISAKMSAYQTFYQFSATEPTQRTINCIDCQKCRHIKRMKQLQQACAKYDQNYLERVKQNIIAKKNVPFEIKSADKIKEYPSPSHYKHEQQRKKIYQQYTGSTDRAHLQMNPQLNKNWYSPQLQHQKQQVSSLHINSKSGSPDLKLLNNKNPVFNRQIQNFNSIQEDLYEDLVKKIAFCQSLNENNIEETIRNILRQQRLVQLSKAQFEQLKTITVNIINKQSSSQQKIQKLISYVDQLQRQQSVKKSYERENQWKREDDLKHKQGQLLKKYQRLLSLEDLVETTKNIEKQKKMQMQLFLRREQAMQQQRNNQKAKQLQIQKKIQFFRERDRNIQVQRYRLIDLQKQKAREKQKYEFIQQQRELSRLRERQLQKQIQRQRSKNKPVIYKRDQINQNSSLLQLSSEIENPNNGNKHRHYRIRPNNSQIANQGAGSNVPNSQPSQNFQFNHTRNNKKRIEESIEEWTSPEFIENDSFQFKKRIARLFKQAQKHRKKLENYQYQSDKQQFQKVESLIRIKNEGVQKGQMYLNRLNQLIKKAQAS